MTAHRDRRLTSLADLYSRRRDTLRTIIFGGETHAETEEWLCSLGGTDLLRRAHDQDSSESREAAELVVGKFMSFVLDDLIASSVQDEAVDEALRALLEGYYWGGLDPARFEGASKQVDAAAKRAFKRLVA
jgi:hypothetical protein